MSKAFSLTFKYGTPQAEEVFFEYLSEFNPYDGLKPRVAVQPMLGGVNVQDSGLFYSDGKITVSGQLMRLQQFKTFWKFYAAPANQREPFVFTSYLDSIPERWKVVWGIFAPIPRRIITKTDCQWSMEFIILGKFGPDGELMP